MHGRWLLLVMGCVALAGCASDSLVNRDRVADMPLAAAHANLLFSLTSGPRLAARCEAAGDCQATAGASDEARFVSQVDRVFQALDRGVRRSYPDLKQQVPDLAGDRFDVYVVEDDDPGSECSADGRIALSSGLAKGRPDDGEVAFIIAREMGHVIARHPEKNSVASLVTSLLMNLVLPGSSLIKSAISAGGSHLAAISQQAAQEDEADRIARRLLESSGYPPYWVADALRRQPMALDDSRWSKGFRRSADKLIAEAEEAARRPLNVVASAP